MTPRSEGQIQRLWAGVAVGSAIIAGISGCAVVNGGPTEEPDRRAGTAFGHIHGLGVDPATGVAYAATHTGVYELPPLDAGVMMMSDVDGPVAETAQDTMGFTMDGGVMFGSGHADPADDPDSNPASLGLIRSSDGAETWESVSLRGEVDFHDIAIAAQPNGDLRIYAYDATSGAIMTSLDDGRSWSTGATIPIRDLTVEPGPLFRVYATTETGLTVSADDGVTFAAIPNAPALYLVDTLDDAAGGLIGVDVDGTVWVKTAAEAWRATGRVGDGVEAMTYVTRPVAFLMLADERGILTSDDFGATWTTVVMR